MPVEELIKQLQALPPGTKVLAWREQFNGYFAVKVSDLDEAKQWGYQYLRTKDGDVKFVAIF